MGILNRKAILDSEDLKTEEIFIPEWNGSVFVRTLTGQERDEFEESMFRGKERKEANFRNLRARLVALTVVDEAGKRLFNLDDMEILGRKSSRALDRIFDVAQRLAGFTGEDIKELEKNSESGPSGDSISG